LKLSEGQPNPRLAAQVAWAQPAASAQLAKLENFFQVSNFSKENLKFLKQCAALSD
jgi:hypothetical protein